MVTLIMMIRFTVYVPFVLSHIWWRLWQRSCCSCMLPSHLLWCVCTGCLRAAKRGALTDRKAYMFLLWGNQCSRGSLPAFGPPMKCNCRLHELKEYEYQNWLTNSEYQMCQHSGASKDAVFFSTLLICFLQTKSKSWSNQVNLHW